MDVITSNKKAEQKETNDRYLENEIPQRTSDKDKFKWMSKKGIAIIIFLIIVFVDPLRWIYISSNATGVKGFYFELMKEIAFLTTLFFCFVLCGYGAIMGYREKSLSRKMILLFGVCSCLLLLGVHLSTLDFAKYVKDISYLNQESYSTIVGKVDKIEVSKGKSSWREKTLYLKGEPQYRLGRYDLSGIQTGDIVYIKYLPTSRFALEINKY